MSNTLISEIRSFPAPNETNIIYPQISNLDQFESYKNVNLISKGFMLVLSIIVLVIRHIVYNINFII